MVTLTKTPPQGGSSIPAFNARYFVPLFAGLPEWKVEHKDGTQMALCYTEFNARLIADALNRR